MSRSITHSGGYLLLLLLWSRAVGAYDYPFSDPYVATILATPPKFAFMPDTEVPVRYGTVRMFPDREAPPVLWYLDELRYSYVKQKTAAPLIFLIAGTGASFKSSKMVAMQKLPTKLVKNTYGIHNALKS